MSTNRQVPGLAALRGAITVDANDAEAIASATEELLRALLERNEVSPEDIVSIIFSATADLDAGFPAAGAHRAGLDAVPLLCTKEIDVPGSLKSCVRVLMHLYTDKDPAGLQHVYLRDAVGLRSRRDEGL